MAVSKIELATGEVLIDLTNDSVTAETLAEGATAHGANGELIVGTMRSGEDLEAVLTEQEQLIAELQETLRGKAAGNGTDTRFAECVMNTLSGEITDDVITSVRTYGLSNLTNVTAFRFPNLRTVASSCFRACTNLETVDFPNLIGNLTTYSFSMCSSLKNVNIPKVTTIVSYAFQNCTSLKMLDLGNISTIQGNSFNGCTNLDTLIIRRTATAATSLENINAFTGTSIGDGVGFIYVPYALLSDYKSATNWSTYAAQIRAIEEYPDICGGGS